MKNTIAEDRLRLPSFDCPNPNCTAKNIAFAVSREAKNESELIPLEYTSENTPADFADIILYSQENLWGEASEGQICFCGVSRSRLFLFKVKSKLYKSHYQVKEKLQEARILLAAFSLSFPYCLSDFLDLCERGNPVVVIGITQNNVCKACQFVDSVLF